MPDEKKLYFNGIDGTTGQYLLPPMKLEDVAALAGVETAPQNILAWLSSVWHKISSPHLGLPVGVDPADVAQAGWGIIFLKDEDPAVVAALQPLIEHRRRQRPDEPGDEAERAAIRELRKHLLWYTRGRRGGAHFRRDADRLRTAADVALLLDEHFPHGTEAFEPDPDAMREEGSE